MSGTQEAEPLRGTEAELVQTFVKFVGGSAAVTKVYGKGVTVSYISTGIVDLIWGENPGKFVGVLGYCFEATTHADVNNFSVVAGVFNTTTRTLRVEIFSDAGSLADLAALNWLTLTLGFKRSGTGV